jgi:hypothetical protein
VGTWLDSPVHCWLMKEVEHWFIILAQAARDRRLRRQADAGRAVDGVWGPLESAFASFQLVGVVRGQGEGQVPG